MKTTGYKLGRIAGFSAACLLFFHMLFFVLAYTKKMEPKFSNYLYFLTASLAILAANAVYRIIKK